MKGTLIYANPVINVLMVPLIKIKGEDINGISESEWKEMSTMEEY